MIAFMPMSVPESVIRAQPSSGAALVLASSASGLDSQHIALDLDIDKGHWSRILSGTAHLPVDKLAELNRFLGNDIFLRWLCFQCFQCGYECRPLLSNMERQIEAERARAKDLGRENAVLRDILQGRR